MKTAKKEFRIRLSEKFNFYTDWKWFKTKEEAIEFASNKYGKENIISISDQTGNVFSVLHN